MIHMTIGKQCSLIMVLMLVATSFALIWVPQVSAAAPTTTVSVDGPQYGTSPLYVNDFTTFTLHSDPDTGALIESIWYKWDNNPYVKYDNPFTAVLILPSPSPDGPPPVPMELIGLHTLYYNATDNQDTHESAKSLEIFIDPKPPTTSISFIGERHEDTLTYINSETRISLTATDESCGVDKISYSLTGSQFTEYTGQFTISGYGAKTLYYYSIDNLGNRELEKTMSLFLDNSGPTVDIDYGTPYYILSGTVYVSSKTVFDIDASDVSGIESIKYNLDGNPWSNYIGPFELTHNREHTLICQATDNLGHTTNETLLIYLDNTPPEVEYAISGTENFIADYGSELTFNCTDAENPDATTHIYYSLDGGSKWYEYENPIILKEDVNVTYYSTDTLDNTNPVEEIKITVNSQNIWSQFYGYWLIVGGIGILFLLYINRGRFAGKSKEPKPKKKVEEETKQEKKASKRK